MARAVLVPLCLCWALGLAAASAPPNILLLLMDDVSGTGGPPGDGTLVTGRKSLGGREGGVRVDGGDVGHRGGSPVCGQEEGCVPVPREGLGFLGVGRCG